MRKPLSGKAINSLLLYFFGCFLVSFTVACSDHNRYSGKSDDQILEATQTGVPPDTIISNSDYCLWRSASIPDTGKVGLIIFFDPQGNGKEPILKYRDLADSMPFILAGSFKSRNGLLPDDVLPGVNHIINSVKVQFPTNQFQVYLAGFSGGGLLATALSDKISECKGLLIAGSPGYDVPAKPFIGFAGLGDANLRDMQLRQSAADKAGIANCIRLWEGIHAWPDTASMEYAFKWIKARTVGNSAVSEFYQLIRKNSAKKQSIREKAIRLSELEFAEKTLGLPSLTTEKRVAFQSSIEFKRYFEEEQASIQSELSQKEFYKRAFMEKDFSWWVSEYGQLTAGKPVPWREQRLLGFLSLMAYAASQRTLALHEGRAAEHFIRLYGLLDPKNPEAFYLLAVFHARNGNQQQCKTAIQQAIDLGFRDKQRIRNQPEFQSIDFDLSLMR